MLTNRCLPRPLLTLALFSVASLCLAQVAPPLADPGSDLGVGPGPSAPVSPPRDLSLYQAQVSLTTQSASERQAATARALAQVLVKLTGDLQAPANPLVRHALANAGSLVVQAGGDGSPSDAEGNTAIGGDPIYKANLTLNFDPVAVDALIASAGLRYWPGNRPKPIVWLAIDDGRGPRLVTAQQTNIVRPLAERANLRGLHLLLPAGSSVEQAAVGRIWALDAAALTPLLTHYGNDTALLGKMYRSVSGWSAWWILSRNGVELARWPITDADPRKVIASGADPAADALARRESVVLDIGEPGKYPVDIVGIGGQAQFLRMMAYLEGLPIVRRVDVVESTPDHLRVMLDLGVGRQGFRQVVSAGDVLLPVTAADDADPDAIPRYTLQ